MDSAIPIRFSHVKGWNVLLTENVLDTSIKSG